MFALSVATGSISTALSSPVSVSPILVHCWRLQERSLWILHADFPADFVCVIGIFIHLLSLFLVFQLLSNLTTLKQMKRSISSLKLSHCGVLRTDLSYDPFCSTLLFHVNCQRPIVGKSRFLGGVIIGCYNLIMAKKSQNYVFVFSKKVKSRRVVRAFRTPSQEPLGRFGWNLERMFPDSFPVIPCLRMLIIRLIPMLCLFS